MTLFSKIEISLLVIKKNNSNFNNNNNSNDNTTDKTRGRYLFHGICSLLVLIFNYQASYNFHQEGQHNIDIERGCPLQTKPKSLYTV